MTKNPGNHNVAGASNVYEPRPLDFELLAKLPVKGTHLGPHTLARTVRSLALTLGEPSSVVNGRMREMKAAGLVVDVFVMGAGVHGAFAKSGTARGWQRTTKGTKALLAHQKGETNGA